MSKVIACIGDSLTNSHNLGVNPIEFWPGVLQASLRAAGFGGVIARNFGRSGWGTGQILNTLPSTWKWEVPAVAVILLGSNDQQTITVAASPAPTTASCTVSGNGTLMPPGTRITIGGVPVTVLTQSGNDLGFVALAAAPTAGQAVVIDTVTNLTLIGQGLLAAGVQKLMMVGKPYQNITSNADTVSAENPTQAALRTMQRDAATALGCPYVDMYQVMRQRIVNGLDVQGSASWHVYQNNVHNNAYGGKIIGEAVAAAILADREWLSALEWAPA